MSKKKVKPIKCKKCGETWAPTEVPTKKEWPKVAPMPSADGSVTITVMATWDCPNCGKSVMGAKGKTKGEFKEEDTKKYKIEHALNPGEKLDLEKLAEDIGVSFESIQKIIPMYIKKHGIKGKIDGKFFVPQ
ncbi:MAG: hypothetical protein ACXABK_05715 [Candidatus Heimdallarchaeaceae archaeon]|jgi:hypothetical protein